LPAEPHSRREKSIPWGFDDLSRQPMRFSMELPADPETHHLGNRAGST